MGTWPVQDAKAKFSELLDAAETSGPQTITRRGIEKAVIVPIDQWRRMNQESKPTLLEILQSGPKGHLPIPPRGSWRMRKPVKF
jgi:prevent-host-death family protein